MNETADDIFKRIDNELFVAVFNRLKIVVAVVFCILSVIVLAHCVYAPAIVSVVCRTEEFELVGYDPPKHFYVDLLNVKTHDLHKHVYVSKHFNSHDKLLLHSKFYALVDIVTYDNGVIESQFHEHELYLKLNSECLKP